MNVVQPMTYWGTGVYQLGVAIIKDAFITAAMGFMNQNTAGTWFCIQKRPLVKESMLFVEGTGLEIVLHKYGLADVDPDALRNGFRKWLKQKKSASSSRIIQEI